MKFPVGTAAARYADCVAFHGWPVALRFFARDFAAATAAVDAPKMHRRLYVVARRVGLFDKPESNAEIGAAVLGDQGHPLAERRVRQLYREGVTELAARLPTDAIGDVRKVEVPSHELRDVPPPAHAAAIRTFSALREDPSTARTSDRTKGNQRVIASARTQPSDDLASWGAIRPIPVQLSPRLGEAAGLLAMFRLPSLSDTSALVDFCWVRRHGGSDDDLVEALLGLLAWPLWVQRVHEGQVGTRWRAVQLRFLTTAVIFGRVREDWRAWPAVVELREQTREGPISDLAISVRIDGSIIASAWGAFGLAITLLDEAEDLLDRLAVKGDDALRRQEQTVWWQQLLYARAGVRLREALWRLTQRRNRIGKEGALTDIAGGIDEAREAVDLAEAQRMPAHWVLRAHARCAELDWAKAVIDLDNESVRRSASTTARQLRKTGERLAQDYPEVDAAQAKTRMSISLVTGDADELEESWKALRTRSDQLHRFPRWALTLRLVAESAEELAGVDLRADALPPTKGIDPLLLRRTALTWHAVVRRIATFRQRSPL